MKLRRAVIENFKCIKHIEIPFEGYDGECRFLTCLVGDNGSGKTTVLQAIGLALSLATHKTPDVGSFRWNGFIPERLGSHGDTRVVLELTLSPQEAKLPSMVVNAAKRRDLELGPGLEAFAGASDKKDIRVIYENGQVTSDEGQVGLSKLRGRWLLKDWLPHEEAEALQILGEVFWFDQYRVIGSGLRDAEYQYNQADQRKWGQPEDSWAYGVNALREFLVGWWTYHKSERKVGRDLIEELEPRFGEIFSGTRFIGVEPKRGVVSPSQRDFFFLFERESEAYDISELSSGEQVVFEILCEFVRLEIARSIVLVDELELHLHPPQQQALLSALPKLGSDCQFIVTTHSPYLENAIPKEETIRLQGGASVGDLVTG